MLAAEFEPVTGKRPKRSAEREAVAFDAGIARDGLDRTLCKVTDISLSGARLHTYSPMTKGAVIWLTLPNLGAIRATVMWADDYVAGCQFHEMLDDVTFKALMKE